MTDFGKAPQVERVVGKLVELVQPQRIYLYNRKVSAREDAITSFKLCIITDMQDKKKAEMQIYRTIDSDVPFDVLLYSPEEWESLSEREDAFAHQIKLNGTVLYG